MSNYDDNRPVVEERYVPPVAEAVVEQRSFWSRFWWLLPLLALLIAIPFIARGCNRHEVTEPVTTLPATIEPTHPAETTPAPEAHGELIPGTNIEGPLEPVTITWMHNFTGSPGVEAWETVAREFEDAHPGVTVNVVSIQNEELRDTVLPNAFQGGNQPDLFQSWGGGELREWANEGIVWDLTNVLAPSVHALGGSAGNWTVDGHNYGLPYSLGPAGFWVNLNVLDRAGLVNNVTHDADGNVNGGTVNWPTTMDGLFEMWATLKEHGETPVAVGGGSSWPAAWWYYYTASMACSPAALTAAGVDHDFSDPCWVQAGEDLQNILDQDAFNDGWAATDAQTGATSASGLIAFSNAAMEWMGPWGGPVSSNLWHEQQGTSGPMPSFLAWFPAPPVAGAPGAGNIMASGDGFSVLNPARGSEARSEAAAALLAFIVSDDVQTRMSQLHTWADGLEPARALTAPPVAPGAIAVLDDPIWLNQASAVNNATFSTIWLDTLVGQEIGTPMNAAIVAFMGGQGSPQGIVDAIKAAAGH